MNLPNKLSTGISKTSVVTRALFNKNQKCCRLGQCSSNLSIHKSPHFVLLGTVREGNASGHIV